MRHVKFYKTKTKWSLYHKNGIPVTGYDRAAAMGSQKAAPGENILLHGRLLMTGIERGRSAAKFTMVDPSGNEFTLTMSGGEKLFHAVADGRIETQMDIWVEDKPWADGKKEHEVPSFLGYWTVAKQGTDYSLIPAPANIIP